MKVTDIMVGDWVMNPFQVDTYESPYAKIDSINGERVTFLLDGFVKITGSEKNLNPIPLTPEMLAKNDFYVNPNYNEGWVVCDKYPDWEISIKVTEQPFRMVIINQTNATDPHDGISLAKKIQFVHELQQAIKTCEIEKEIRLWL